MKIAIACFLLIATAAFAADSLQQQIVAKEREELEALKSADYPKFADLIAEDAVFLNPQGPGTKAQVVENVKGFKLLDFSMEDIHFVKLSASSGVVSYKLTQKGSAHGREFTSQVWASAVWTQRGGKWVTVFSQETPAKKASSE